MKDAYYQRPEVSNSDLTALKKYFYPDFITYDPEVSFRFSNLIDFMITEPHKVDFFKRKIEGYEEPFSIEDFKKASNMRASFMKDDVCAQLIPLASFQKVFTGVQTFNYGGVQFSINMRCKFDMFMDILKWGADIKSTSAATMKAFTDACYHFDYDRSRVLYMLLSGSSKDMIIGISKVNCKVFKIPITRGDAFWQSGMEKITQLAFQYWLYFENFKIAA